MKVLIIGSGGREHALAWKLRRSARVHEIFVAPGNAGTARVATNAAISAGDFPRLLKFAEQQDIDLTVVGPDNALAGGVVDLFEDAGRRVFGPRQAAARLESSKSFAKDFMVRHGMPTAFYAVCRSRGEARAALANFSFPVAIKADGLALGKGVVIAHDRPEAERAFAEMIEHGRFGEAGHTVVLEEFLVGTECSVHALVDGRNFILFPTAQDHKQLYEGNHGPNTGGMGTFSPSDKLAEPDLAEIRRQILEPFLHGIQADKLDYRGLLFPGLMLTSDGPKVLEFNCRFGDPETQALIPRLESDLLDLLEATLERRLDQVTPAWTEQAAVCVVLASGGYPDQYETRKPIAGLPEAEQLEDVLIFHAGTQQEDNRVLTAGGRVLGVTALGANLPTARRRAYDAVERINFDGCYFRRDIGLI
ncbi:MAG: phosphoribosylamine--glycine ligase [Verrucomicrobia bacterium]|nr:phosphoribosylamine--glycine ligase [Verrucomicrobiota bacterium]